MTKTVSPEIFKNAVTHLIKELYPLNKGSNTRKYMTDALTGRRGSFPLWWTFTWDGIGSLSLDDVW